MTPYSDHTGNLVGSLFLIDLIVVNWASGANISNRTRHCSDRSMQYALCSTAPQSSIVVGSLFYSCSASCALRLHRLQHLPRIMRPTVCRCRSLYVCVCVCQIISTVTTRLFHVQNVHFGLMQCG